MFIVTPIVGVCNCSMLCCALLCVYSSDGEGGDCFALFVFLVSRKMLPRDIPRVLSAVCDCGIS